MERPIFSILSVLLLLILATTAVVLYAQGYHLDLSKKTVEKTGMILAKSIPEGAKVYLDGKLITATNSPISNLKPGSYLLKIEKEGYASWEKEIPVKEGLVTDVTALLPPLSPTFSAVTQNGARLITAAPSGNKAVFISGKGLYLLNLTNPPLGFLRTSPQKITEETEEFVLSKATKLIWSPNEDQVLVTIGKRSYLVAVTGRNGRPTLAPDVTGLLKNWNTTTGEQRKTMIKEMDLSEELAKEAVKPTTSWSPDEREFLYVKALPTGRQEFWVVNLSDPLPVGEEKHQMIWETENSKLQLFWLADSHHFVMIEEGAVSLLDLDGSNKRDLFRGTLAEPIAISTADLSKIIIVTSFTPKANPNLYAIGLR
ncbi:hypothetical protein COT70_01770 [candidate division WWE3 bacterium CG09_land_8_20_14_0_10_47_33]|uniref:PEGA domain-containing protein n=1 Tax=candidate division WWE3 bacterium CG_4_9_14_0_2_um_filter_48_10 TaxID=1975078 RepID=A0A2M8EJW0_UNCKA|nr:MAG: hypothetical protein COT70_01770 [candidate division WWE3 bacterium CG09_land_8_20_14_0_10_47_33]PIZ40888.1 MAG: hypothetical protein COY35_01495 [candidate division WWE3 bacterium CG_4_10_14_0_2_um_filter_47_8]PJC23031.1 MAG: hypothetical protein CO059_00815 [candidate division WWE3 bacterium CG_4_9_14_0_2_um_filter_48_10]PJE51702.1 MAG: hypothetical protein COV28_01930 [candidate division WWE3 bacterium CG10_big_fil_rev_8_21_14_0_10_48_23]